MSAKKHPKAAAAVSSKGSVKTQAKVSAAPAAPAKAKKAVSKVMSAEKKEEIRAKNAKKAETAGFEAFVGIPEQEYLVLEDKNWAAMIQAMFGTPGFVKGKIIEIAAKSDQGKSALADTIGALLQKQGVPVAKVDAERSMNAEFATKLGYNAKTILYSKPLHGEGAFAAVRHFLDKGAKYMVLDSSAACTPQSMLADKNDMSALARLLSVEMKKTDSKVDTSGCVLVIIGQVKEKPGVAYGNPEYITGGSAVGFHSRVRMQLRSVEREKDDLKQETKKTVRVTITKNHTGPKRTIPFDIVVDNLFRPLLTETAVKWAENFKLIDKENETICGISYAGRKKEAALAGHEKVVFDAVDSWYKNREADQKAEDYGESTDDTAAILDENFAGDLVDAEIPDETGDAKVGSL